MNVNFSQSQANVNTRLHPFENINVPDFSQGDHEASGVIPLNKTKDPIPFEVEGLSEGINFLKHHQNLTEGYTEDEYLQDEDTDDDSLSCQSITNETTNIHIPTKHVDFKLSSNQSLADLRRESKSLLSVKELKTTSQPTVETIGRPAGETNTATIFDLCFEDRHRVGKLIAELASALEKNTQLEEKVQTVKRDKERFKHKSSDLMKKVDSLGERCHKLDNEREQLKEKHLQSLTTLQNKITKVSEQFEISAQEIQRLTMENQQLKSENKTLRLTMSAQEVKLRSSEELHFKTKSLLEESRQREKVLKNEVQQISLERKYQEDDLKSRIAKQLETSLKIREQNRKKEKLSSESHPASASKLQVPKTTNLSPLFLSKETESKKLEISDPPKTETTVGTGSCKHIDEKEEAILQELFFRF